MDTHPAAMIRLARIMAPVTVLGPGRRVGVWVQGCALACPDCCSRDTWDAAGGQTLSVAEFIDQLKSALIEAPDGITFSGGEPTDQASAIVAAIDVLRVDRPDLDVLVFTGRTLAAARIYAPDLVERASAVVAGPYRSADPHPGHRLLASRNQTLTITSQARPNYEAWLSDDEAPQLQVLAHDGGLQLVGMPRPGDLPRFEAELARRGVVLEGISW